MVSNLNLAIGSNSFPVIPMFSLIKKPTIWMLDHIVGTSLTLFLLSITMNVAFAGPLLKTPTNIQSSDVSFLRTQLPAADVTITLEPLEKYVNAVLTEGCFDTASGFILITDHNGQQETASYGNKSCDSSNVTTLTNVRRGLNPTNVSFGTGTGIAFDAGAEVRVIDYPLMWNNAVYIDSRNTFTEIQAIKFSGCGSFQVPTFATIAERDAQLANPKDFEFSAVTDTGAMFQRIGGAWVTVGQGTVPFASETVAGKLEVGTLAEHKTRTQTGSTSAVLGVRVSNLISSAATYYPAQLICGSGGTSVIGTWTSVTDGEFSFTFNGTSIDVTAINFAAAADMTEVAGRIQGQLNVVASGTGHTVTWEGTGTSTGFTIVSSDLTGGSSGSTLIAVSGGGGTDISGAGTIYMDCDVGSLNVLQHIAPIPNHVSDESKVVMLNHDGYCDVSLGCTGTGKHVLGELLVGANTGTVTTLGSTSGEVLTGTADGGWTSRPVRSVQTLLYTVADQGKLGASSTQTATGAVMTFDADQFKIANDGVHIIITGEYRDAGGTHTIEVFLDSVKIATHLSPATLNTSGTQAFIWHISLKATAVGGSGTMKTESVFHTAQWEAGTGKSSDSDTIDTTKALALEITSQFSTSNAANYVNPFTYYVVTATAP